MAKRDALKPWERQEKESVPAYEAFSLYLKQGDERSIRKVARELGKSATLMARWSKDWRWQERSREYDIELRRIEMAEAKKAVRKMQERQIQTAVLMQKKALEALKSLDVEKMNANEIMKMFAEAAKIEKEARAAETPEENTQTTLADTIVSAYKRRMNE